MESHKMAMHKLNLWKISCRSLFFKLRLLYFFNINALTNFKNYF